MDNIERSQRRGGISRLIIAALAGYVTPFISAMMLSMQLPVVGLSSAVIGAMSAGRKKAPVLACGLAATVSAGLYLGWVYALVMLAAGVLPAVIMTRDMDKKVPFGEQVQKSVFLHILGAFGAVAILYAVIGGDIVGYYAKLFGESMALLDESYFEALAPAFSAMLGTELTAAGAKETMLLAVEDAKTILEYLLPGMIVSGSIVTGVLTAAAGNRARAQIGEASAESYLPMSKWTLPYGMATAIFAALIAVFLFTGEGGTGEVAFYAVYYVAATAYIIRLVSWTQEAFDRRRMGKIARIVIYAVALVLSMVFGLFPALVTSGGMIAVFGRNGDVHRHLTRRLQKMGHTLPDDPEEFIRKMQQKQREENPDDGEYDDEYEEDDEDDDLK